MFFCKQKTACEMRISDWSSDVCSSDLTAFTIEAQSARVFVIGDSASASSTTGIGDDLATAYPPRTFYQQGIGGQLWMGHIRKRAGLANPLLTVPGGPIPSNGSAVAGTFDLRFLLHMPTDVVPQLS